MLQPAYEGLMDINDIINNYPNAKKVTTDTFFLGTSPVISDIQLEYIEKITNSFFKETL
jgi:hypothetical protein